MTLFPGAMAGSIDVSDSVPPFNQRHEDSAAAVALSKSCLHSKVVGSPPRSEGALRDTTMARPSARKTARSRRTATGSVKLCSPTMVSALKGSTEAPCTITTSYSSFAGPNRASPTSCLAACRVRKSTMVEVSKATVTGLFETVWKLGRVKVVGTKNSSPSCRCTSAGTTLVLAATWVTLTSNASCSAPADGKSSTATSTIPLLVAPLTAVGCKRRTRISLQHSVLTAVLELKTTAELSCAPLDPTVAQ